MITPSPGWMSANLGYGLCEADFQGPQTLTGREHWRQAAAALRGRSRNPCSPSGLMGPAEDGRSVHTGPTGDFVDVQGVPPKCPDQHKTLRGSISIVHTDRVAGPPDKPEVCGSSMHR